MTRRLLLALLLFTWLAGPAVAEPQASAELRAAGERVVRLLRGGEAPQALFTPTFLAQVPEAQVRAIAQQLGAQYGAARRLAGIDAQSAVAGVLHIETERAVLHMSIVIEPAAPHRISGLLLAGADLRGDDMDAILAEVRGLPGRTGLAVARLGDGAPSLTASLEAERPLAIGSAFKLWILAELCRQVQAGERRWSDVVPLDRRSSPSGTLYSWPEGAPITLHSLAALMISQSDNTATDILLRVAGRENVERMMTTIGVGATARNRPLLSTLELFAIKSAAAPAFNAWQQADEAGRRQILARDYAEGARIDGSRFTGSPLRIDSVEWFASPADLVRTLDWLRRHGDETSHAILAINPGLGGPARSAHAYLGYKGGSEPGVLNLSWLIRTRAGSWYAVTGTWNNDAAPLDEARFTGLMARAIQLVR